MMIYYVCDLCDAHSSTSRRKRAANDQNVRSPKLRSPKELSPGIPRRPTAPREPGANVPDAGSSRCGTRTPRSTAEHRVPRRRGNTPLQEPYHRGNTPLQAPHQQQPDDVQRRQDAADKSTASRRHRVTVSSEKFAQSQLQVNSVTNCCVVIMESDI